jgi:hypothetical protein
VGSVGGDSETRDIFYPTCFTYPYRLSKFCTGIRYYSTSTRQITFDNYKDITSEVLNNLLSNQEVTITEEKLTKLKNIPGVRFDLPFTDQTYSSYVSLVGKPKSRG